MRLTTLLLRSMSYQAWKVLIQMARSQIGLNGPQVSYFDCPVGVKQGDCLSPTLFAIFINDLARDIRSSGVGVELKSAPFNSSTEAEIVNILLYADDIVLLADNENDLQTLLAIVENWCYRWRLEVNLSKTNIMHIRKKRAPQSR